MILVRPGRRSETAEQDNPGFKRGLAFLRNKLLMGYGLPEEVKAQITDAKPCTRPSMIQWKQ